jgi:peptidoglycan-associated lipoprotein
MKFVRTPAWALLAAVAVMAGCASTVPLESDVPVESRTPGSAGANGAGAGANAGGAGQSQVASVDLASGDAPADNKLPRVVYFDFDSFVVKDDFKPVVASHARLLTSDRAKRLSIEGHTDERGGREYNLALGQKRAEAVAKSLTLLGANANQLEAVSFGKERPAATGSDESAWAQNRRAELNYR